MNTIEKRLDKLETLIKAKRIEKGFIVLYDEYGKRVDGVVIKMPTSEAEGLARLADGTEQGIVYQAGWNNGIDIFQDETLIIEDEKEIDVSGKLVMRNKANTRMVFKGVDLSKFPKPI